jgi:hypothetical protein
MNKHILVGITGGSGSSGNLNVILKSETGM